MADRPEPFRVEKRASGWCVVNAADRVIMACGEERSAAHYATLLCQAWRDGYRAGYARQDEPLD